MKIFLVVYAYDDLGTRLEHLSIHRTRQGAVDKGRGLAEKLHCPFYDDFDDHYDEDCLTVEESELLE